MGNPLHKLFKKLFTGPQKKGDAEEEQVEHYTKDIPEACSEADSKVQRFEEETRVRQKDIQVEENIEIEEDIKIQEDIQVDEDIEIQENVEIQEDIEIQESVEVQKDIEAEKDIEVQVQEYIETQEDENLVEREIIEYIATKTYEEKLIKQLETQGITKTTQMNWEVVRGILQAPGMTEGRAKSLLGKFKGYIAFSAASMLFTREEWAGLECGLDWRIHIKIQPIYSELKIKDVFKESGYEPLHKLAKIKEISKLGEMTTAFLVSYKNYTGVGSKKYKKTLEILAQYSVPDKSFACVGIMQQEEAADDYEICLEPHLYEIFNNYTLGKIGMIYGIDVSASVRKIKLKQLEGKSINEVSGLVNRPALEDSLRQIGEIVVPSLAFEKYEGKEGLEVLRYRFEEGCSLEETADRLGQTLEITSKMQMQTLEELTEILRTSKLVEILNDFNKGDHHVAFKVVEDILGERNKHIISLIKHNTFHDLGYSAIFNMVFLYEELGEEELIERLSDELPEVFELSSYEKKIKKTIEALGIKKWGKDVIPQLLKELGYNVSGKLYSRTDDTSSYILDMIFRDKVKKPLYLDEDGVEFLVEEAQKEYHYDLGNNILTIERKIKHIEAVLQVGSNTYLHSSRLKIKTEIIEEIENYLAEVKQNQSKINSNVLYSRFKDKLKGSSIQDQYGLYHMIFYYFGADYEKEDETSLNIILRHEETQVGKFIDLEQVAPRLQQLINNHMDYGYIKTQRFLQEVCEREELKAFLQANHLDDYKVMAQVLKAVDDTLLGGDDFLYRVNSLYKSIQELEAAQV